MKPTLYDPEGVSVFQPPHMLASAESLLIAFHLSLHEVDAISSKAVETFRARHTVNMSPTAFHSSSLRASCFWIGMNEGWGGRNRRWEKETGMTSALRLSDLSTRITGWLADVQLGVLFGNTITTAGMSHPLPASLLIDLIT